MKNSFTKLLLATTAIALLALCNSACESKETDQERKRKVVFIIVDGIPGDVIQKLNPPVLAEISREGGFTLAYVGGAKDNYSETPTISAVGYNSLLTGTWVNKHNVWDNDIAAPNYNYWNLFRIAEKTNPELKTAIFSTWEDNRTKLVGEGLEPAGNIQLDFKFDGLEHDTVRYPHDNASKYIHQIDEAVAEQAGKVIAAEGPDLSWVYLQYTDDMGHHFGDSPQFNDAIMIADKQVGKVWEAIKKREKEFAEDWLIVVTTDHGRDAETGHNHGGQSDRERSTWIVTNAKERNLRFEQNPGIVDIFPSICNYLNLAVPEDVLRESDGVPFIGVADIADLHAEKQNDTIVLTWKSLSENPSGDAEVLVALTNHFKEGGKDDYQKAGEVSPSAGRFEFKAAEKSDYYKIVLKTPKQYVNTWITDQKPERRPH